LAQHFAIARQNRPIGVDITLPTAFFASTSLFAVGGALALLRTTNEALVVLGALPADLSPLPALWEVKCLGLILIFVYTFVKFAWRTGCSSGRCRRLRNATRPGRRHMSSGRPKCSQSQEIAGSAPSSRWAISAGLSVPGFCS
jgi:hypothetical protein